MASFYTIKDEWHSESCACELQIEWNVEQIAQMEKADGYIVQIYRRELFPKDALPDAALKDIEYAEAWRVVDGVVIAEDRTEEWNDAFAVGRKCADFEEFACSAGTAGHFEFHGKVCWVSQESTLFQMVDDWSREAVKQEGGLKASYCTEGFEQLQFLERDVFMHSWDLSSDEKVYAAAKEKLFRYCPCNTERNEQVLYLFP